MEKDKTDAAKQEAEELGALLMNELSDLFGGIDKEIIALNAAVLYTVLSSAGYRKADRVSEELQSENKELRQCARIALRSYTRMETLYKLKRNECKTQKSALRGAVKDILDEVAKHVGGAWLVELYKKYDIKIDD